MPDSPTGRRLALRLALPCVSFRLRIRLWLVLDPKLDVVGERYG